MGVLIGMQLRRNTPKAVRRELSVSRHPVPYRRDGDESDPSYRRCSSEVVIKRLR